MKLSVRQYARRILLGTLLLILAAWVLPLFFSAERYRRRLEIGLQQTLRRPVSFGAIHLRLLPRPSLEIESAIVHEDPAFGSEPFARVDQIQCALGGRSLWHSGPVFSRLLLIRPSLNVVLNARGALNLESLLSKADVVAPVRDSDVSRRSAGPPAVELALEEARINFKSGANKKPFAITHLHGQITLDPGRRVLRFHLIGNPIRAGISFPSPGPVELAGEWSPGPDLDGPLAAVVRARGGLVYNWIPLVTGRNSAIYGVLDADLRLSGTIREIKVEGEGRLAQIHRWEQIPPSDSLSCKLSVRGEVNRRRGRVFIESLDASFAGSRVHASGLLENVPAEPALDIVVAVERSRIEDLLALGRRLWGSSPPIGVAGRVSGLVTVQGAWAARRYGGFLTAEQVRLVTSRGTFPVSDVAMRIGDDEVRLAPVVVSLAPRVQLVAEGSLQRNGGRPAYEIALSAKSAPLKDLANFGRALGLRAVQGVDVDGSGSATVHLAGRAWLLTPAAITGHAEVHGARLSVAGLTKAVEIPRARIQFNGEQVIAEPVAAVVGNTSFTVRLEHRGGQKEPWRFSARTNALDLGEGATWFEALNHPPSPPLLERLHRLKAFAARRATGANALSRWKATGQFVAGTLSYRGVTLRNFRSAVSISEDTLRVDGATFRAGEGSGQGSLRLDLSARPAKLVGDIRVDSAKVQSLTRVMPPSLQEAEGAVSGAGHFETHGSTAQEMRMAVQGEAALRLKNVSFGSFDPLDALVRQAGLGTLEPARSEANLRSASAALEISDRRVVLKDCVLDFAGAKLALAGNYSFGQLLDLDVRADLRNLRRRWISDELKSDPKPPQLNLRLAGPLEKLSIVSEAQASRVTP